MSLADEIAAISDKPCCTTGEWYQQQSTDDREAVDSYVGLIRAGEGRWSALHDVCGKHGLQISNKSFREHWANHVNVHGAR